MTLWVKMEEADIAAGVLFTTYCAACHGLNAVSAEAPVHAREALRTGMPPELAAKSSET